MKKQKNVMKKQLKLIPIMQMLIIILGIIFMELNDYQKAKDCFEKVIELILIMKNQLIHTI